MNRPDETTRKLLHIAEAVCSGAGYDLVDVRFVREQGGWVLQVFIDLPGWLPGQPGGIGFEDCERVSRELGTVLDVEDPIPQAYRLEVSSPGVERPLRTADHFRRFVGQTVKMTLREGVGGRRNFKGTVVGVEPAADAAGAPDADVDLDVVLEVDGTRYRLPLGDLSSARLVPDWDEVFKTAANLASDPASGHAGDRGSPASGSRGK
jgi:ribosome maturation factor RimP